MTLGEKIKTVCSMKGFSQEYVAEKIGIATSTFSKIEQNKISPNWERINEIAGVLEITSPELVTFGEKNVLNLHGSTNHGFVGNVVMGTLNDTQILIQRIEKLEKELVALQQKFAQFKH